jgi:Fe-S-cluster-containing dehydrogenase component
MDPACVAACVPGALTIVDLEQPLPEAAQESLAEFPTIRFTQPSLRFIPSKPTKCFWRSL